MLVDHLDGAGRFALAADISDGRLDVINAVEVGGESVVCGLNCSVSSVISLMMPSVPWLPTNSGVRSNEPSLRLMSSRL
jgi:hypothetical protein